MKKILIVSSCLTVLLFSVGFSRCCNDCHLNRCNSSYLSDINPRGQERPHDGRGGGQGVRQGRGEGRNQEPCDRSGPGYGQGGGRGQYRTN